MAITELHVSGYRSIRDIHLKLKNINVLIGPNGCGKSNLYQSMFLLAAAVGGQLASTLAQEGGMPSILWAGKRRAGAVRMSLEVTISPFSYSLALGLPEPTFGLDAPTQFHLDPDVKEEHVFYTDSRRKKVLMLERKGPSAKLRDLDGKLITYPLMLMGSESVFPQLQEPHLYPELSALRQELNQWRFYHHFRTDSASALRQPQIGVRTPILSNDGYDLAAALQTIIEIGDEEGLREVIDSAFPGSSIQIQSNQARFSLFLRTPGMNRPLDARELSDGTLRYLCLISALLSPRPPALLALNEPETSLHPDLLEPLAKLVVKAAKRSQIWITTHSGPLANFIGGHSGEAPIQIEKIDGETRITNQNQFDEIG